MSRAPIVEPMYDAYSRYRRTHHRAGWGDGSKHPFVMRGESELRMSMIKSRTYNKMLNSITKGYLQEQHTMMPHVVKIATLASPFRRFPVGYLGKTQFTLWMPSEGAAINLRKEIVALNTMVDAVKSQSVIVSGTTKWGFHAVECSQYVSSWDPNPTGSNYAAPTQQLKPLFNQLRTVIDANMKTWLAMREPFVEWLIERPIITIPFDSTTNRMAFTKLLQQRGEASE